MSPAPTPPKPLSTAEIWVLVGRKPVYYLAGLAVLFTGCNTLGDRAAARWSAQQPREAATGLMIGGAPMTLGPEDASTAVLLIHGYLGGPNNFGDLPEQLAAAGFHVRAMRLPGHGTSPQDMALTPQDAYLSQVLAEYAELNENHDRVILAGHSMGGALATLAAERVNPGGLVLAAPYFGVTYKWYYVLPAEAWSAFTRPFVKWAYKSDHFIQVNDRGQVNNIFSYRWVPTEGNFALMNLGKSARDKELLQGVTCPVLWLHGPGDNAAAYQRAKVAFRAMASESKRHVRLKRSNHHVFWDYDREVAVAAVVNFARERAND